MNDSTNGADATTENRAAGPVRVGLALSGGATKAVAHVGVIKALVEDGVVIESITATSGGAIVGALYASGISVEDLEHIALSMSWKSMAQLSLSRVGFLSSEQIERFLVQTIGDRTFSQLEIPFAVIATNLVAGTRHVFREGRVALAVRASCSIPQIYHPVEIDGQYYVDGGLVEDLPLLTLTAAFSPPVTVGVNLTANASLTRRPRHFLHLQWHLGVIVSRMNAMAMESLGDVIVRPNLQPYSSLHFRNIPEMVDEGYRAARSVLPDIYAAWNTYTTRLRERTTPTDTVGRTYFRPPPSF